MSNSIIIDRSRSLSPEQAELREAAKRLNEEAEAKWHHDPSWRREQAANIGLSIVEGFENLGLVDLMLDVERVGYNDTITISRTRGLRAHWVARGGYIEMSTLRKDVTDMPRDTLGIHIGELEEKMVYDFAVSQAELSNFAVQRFTAEWQHRVAAVLRAATPSGHSSLISGAFSLAAINTAIRQVRDESEGEVIILGRPSMTQKILDQLTLNANGQPVGFLPETNEALVTRGSIGTYRGARIIELRNVLNAEGNSVFPANEMYIYAKDMGKAGFFGPARLREWTENEIEEWHMTMRMDIGFMITHTQRMRRVVDTGQSA